MPLCSNRPEGFGPLSTHPPHIPTTCFIDTILLPLCTYLYLLTLLLLFRVFRIHPRPTPHKPRSHTHPATPFANNPPPPSTTPHQRTATHSALLTLYSLLLLAQLCMCALEITRLSLAHLGIGLLPFTFVALLLAWVLHVLASEMERSQRTLTGLTQWRVVGRTGRVRVVRWVNLGLWVGLGGGNGLKIVAEGREGPGGRYEVRDRFVGGAVVVGVYVAMGVLEVVT